MTDKKEKKSNGIILLIFLLGIFMGAMDNGIVSPAREIIQNGFGVASGLGIWMITIYTLTFAISMPIVSKLSDRLGYRKIYIFGISTFGLGSLLCGLTSFTDNFSLFLIARVIQAIGAGGIIPIATNVISQSFPIEKRGTALGLVGAMYGMATILGPTIGSFVLNLVGTVSWFWLFFVNVPISLTIILLSYKIPKLQLSDDKKPIDFAGAVLLAVVIGSLMYALTNIDFFHFVTSIKSINVFPYLISFIVFLPILILVERKVVDPMLNIKYFENEEMVLIFILSFVVGIGMMGMVFIPQFSENVMRITPGTGGYIVTILALFSGIASPLSGRLIDKKGAKFVIIIGFTLNILGTLSMAFLATRVLSFVGLLPGLILMGIGVGFTIGAPLNYLILQTVPKEEGATALGTMSLMRSIGVAMAPNLMIGFVINATKQLQSNIMNLINVPQNISITNASSGSSAFANLQNADVTTIVDKLKDAISSVVPQFIQKNVLSSIESSRNAIENVFQSTLNTGYSHIYLTSALIATTGLVIAIFLKEKKMQKTEKEENVNIAI